MERCSKCARLWEEYAKTTTYHIRLLNYQPEGVRPARETLDGLAEMERRIKKSIAEHDSVVHGVLSPFADYETTPPRVANRLRSLVAQVILYSRQDLRWWVLPALLGVILLGALLIAQLYGAP